jgi:predicted glycosyltransferase
MKILVEILHPAHLHFFRNAIREWTLSGDQVLVLAREKDCAEALLATLGRHPLLTVKTISKKSKFSFLLPFEFLLRMFRLFRMAKVFSPDVMVGIMGITIAPIGRLLKIPTLVFYDTEVARLTNWIAFGLATRTCVPSCFQGDAGPASIRHPSYHELSYLHESVFVPDRAVLSELQISKDQIYFIVRFVSLNSSHDLNVVGLNSEQKTELVNFLSKRGAVFISTEAPLPKELVKFAFPLSADRLLHALAFATAVVGESATVSSEAAMLGVPAFYLSTSRRGYTDELEATYGLVFNDSPKQFKEALSRIQKVLDDPETHHKMKLARMRMLSEKGKMHQVIVDQVRSLVQ